ncbi:hypothetical protein GCWU000325_00210 [Alloprevotella tannerae ATCC 51259]|uniref:Uncharacterized protein n=1 Tax=Alloprevotella tannerae ATCC 51259 TaxID=626522 RepID=C9LDD9_9BACT|nr:hypothetical protein GCWU000325_00210 [Alloprevotella tannerae ATCC 51259]
MYPIAALIVCCRQTIVWWEHTIVWRQQTMVWWQQTKVVPCSRSLQCSIGRRKLLAFRCYIAA